MAIHPLTLLNTFKHCIALSSACGKCLLSISTLRYPLSPFKIPDSDGSMDHWVSGWLELLTKMWTQCVHRKPTTSVITEPNTRPALWKAIGMARMPVPRELLSKWANAPPALAPLGSRLSKGLYGPSSCSSWSFSVRLTLWRKCNRLQESPPPPVSTSLTYLEFSSLSGSTDFE